MLASVTKHGDYYMLLLEPGLVEKAGLSESMQLEVCAVGSSLIISPLPETGEEGTNRAAAGLPEKPGLAPGVLRRLAE